MSEDLQETIKNKAIELGDKLRDNSALDSIAKAQIIKSLGELESFVLALLDAFLRDNVTMPLNEYNNQIHISRKQLWEKIRVLKMKYEATKKHQNPVVIYHYEGKIEALEELLAGDTTP